MPADAPSERRRPGACQQCRTRKVKCSGTYPCTTCLRRAEECRFEEDRRISVSRREYMALKHRLSQFKVDKQKKGDGPEMTQDGLRPTPSSMGNSESNGPAESDVHLDRNPLVSPSSFVHRTGKRRRTWFFRGPTSSWGFTQRVLSMMAERMSPTTVSELPFITDGESYQIRWECNRADDPPDVSDLPSHDHALYLVSTVKFHLGLLLQLYDEEDFLFNLKELYENVYIKVQTSRLWYVQFLVIIAFGEAFLAPSRMTGSRPVCSKYFIRAMSLLPDPPQFWEDPILTIEVLTAISLYFYSLDMRDSSCSYIGQAVRIAFTEGLHRALPPEIDQKFANRCTRIWWTVYILESKITASEGVPSSIRDEDVTSNLWDLTNCSNSAAGLTMHVKVTRVMGQVLNTVYRPDEELKTLYLQKVRSSLQLMANLSYECEQVFEMRFRNSVDAVSGLTTRLNLSYHFCIIIIIRPLLFSLLVERLDHFTTSTPPRPLSATVRTLVQSCIDSAIKSLKILETLHYNNLLETFLPFDLEYTFASTFVLRLATVIVPVEARNTAYNRIAKEIIDDLIRKGNGIAQVRQSELEVLDRLIEPIFQQPAAGVMDTSSHFHPSSVSSSSPAREGAIPVAHRSGSVSDNLTSVLDMDSALDFEWNHPSEGGGLLSEQILSVVNKLAVDDPWGDVNIASLGEDRWFWDDSGTVE